MRFLLNFSSDYAFSKVDTFFDQTLQLQMIGSRAGVVKKLQ